MSYDVLIVGGGPAGLSAALALGRARKRVLVCDAGPRRNAAAVGIHNFVTRDGIPPDDFRRIAREQLRSYPNVEVRDAQVDRVTGTKGAFRVSVGAETLEARRILVCTGMVDQTLPIEGFRELWGHAIFQCPYCHGWEVQDRQFGFLARPEHASHVLPFAIQLRAWSKSVTLFTAGAIELTDPDRSQLEAAGLRIVTAPISRLVARGQHLEAVELEGGEHIPCEVLFAHPPQQQTRLVQALGLGLDGDGFVQVDPMRRETSVPGIYAAGDLTMRKQSAVAAADSGQHAASFINLELTLERVEPTAP